MADSWRDRQSRAARTARSVESMSPGTLKGRVAQASPVRKQPRSNQDPDDNLDVHVAPAANPPDEAPLGKLWFITDEVV